MRTSVVVLLTAAGTLALVVVAALLVIYTGAYDVAATTEHTGVTRWALSRLQEESVERRAASVAGSAPSDPAEIEHGFEHFDAMCVQCHGAPGIDRGELGQGMRPVPPELSEEVSEWSAAELFWITKHGIRLAGMPAFGPTHSDEQIWGIVGFLNQLDGMSSEEYAARRRGLQAAADSAGGEGGHSHAPGTPAHSH